MIDRELSQALLFLKEQGGSASWKRVKSLTTLTSSTMVGLVTRGLASASPLGEDNELLDGTVFALTDEGVSVAASIRRGDAESTE